MASAAGGRGFAEMIHVLPGLAEAFEHDGVLLDVGVGVAGLACAFCEAVPGSRVIGLDVLPRALTLARRIVAEKGLDSRVDLRQLGIEEFHEEAVADLAHMSPVFIPPAVLPEGLNRIRAALKTGGWLALSGIVLDDDTVTRWMAHQAGGSALTDAEATRLTGAAGFAAPVVAPLPPGAPRVLLFRAD
jgi:precorrin-6B methylase 2